MKQFFAGIIGFSFLIVIIGLFISRSNSKLQSHVSSTTGQTENLPSNNSLTKTLFVPYWALPHEKLDAHSYTTLVYFGILVNEGGIIVTDPGTKSVDAFLSSTDHTKERLLAVRMLDSDVNSAVIDSNPLQKKITSQSIQFAKDKGFDGIVLDFEFSALAFSSVVDKVDAFMQNYANESHNSHLSFYPMVYGDSFFRARPYDVSKIASYSDGIYIMAYDFHKAKSGQGPNFPLNGSETYGYDMVHMTKDFLAHTQANKITIVYGMYGYDWTTDIKGQPSDIAKSLSMLQMQQFFSHCTFTACSVSRDDLSAEMHGSYISVGKKHDIWYEDMESATKKTIFLQSQGISSVGYWAYSYF